MHTTHFRYEGNITVYLMNNKTKEYFKSFLSFNILYCSLIVQNIFKMNNDLVKYHLDSSQTKYICYFVFAWNVL